jgi:hypothetical protein
MDPNSTWGIVIKLVVIVVVAWLIHKAVVKWDIK